MKTRMFVAEVLWLFLGLCLCPQSADRTEEVNQRTDEPTTRTPDVVCRDWTVSSLVRPPPRGQREPSKTNASTT